MTTKLQNYFPIIRSREEIKAEIEQRPDLKQIFYGWKVKRREEFLDFCSGVRGINVMYDFVSKAILDPDATPERLNDLLSVLLNQKVQIKNVLPLDGGHVTDDQTLIVMDLLVELEDGSLANLEIQKIGYKFPGQRSACYSADLLLRQYKRVRSKCKEEIMKYNDIKDVYAIVFFEKSTQEFHDYPDIYLHHFEQRSDTGLKIDLLQKFLFVPLDIYQKNQQNKTNNELIESRLDAWLNFFSSSNPEVVIAICEKYPDFKEMYHQIYVICRNLEDVMMMFSEELRQLDNNTARFMIDELQDQMALKDEALDQKVEELAVAFGEIRRKSDELDRTSAKLEQASNELAKKSAALERASSEVRQKNTALAQTSSELEQTSVALKLASSELEQKSAALELTSSELEQKSAALEQTSTDLQQKSMSLKQMALTMASSGISLDVIATSANVTIETIQSWLSEQ